MTRRNKIIQTTTYKQEVQGWIFTVIRGEEYATLKTKQGTYKLKQSHYNNKLFRGNTHAFNIEMQVAAGVANLSYKPSI